MVEARNFRVGLFVLLGVALTGACAVLLGGGDMLRGAPLVFETYFDESVQGLDVGAPVTFRGVRIGRVARIALAADVYHLPPGQASDEMANRVVVICEVARSEERTEEADRAAIQQLVDSGVRLKLASVGITGVAFLEADYVDPERFPPMEVRWTPERLYIPSAPSTFRQFSTAAERIFERLENTDIERAVDSAAELMANLDTRVKQVDLGRTQRGIDALLAELRATNQRIQRTIDGGRYDLEMTLENLRVSSENLRDLTDTARSYPSLMILGAPPAESGVSPE